MRCPTQCFIFIKALTQYTSTENVEPEERVREQEHKYRAHVRMSSKRFLAEVYSILEKFWRNPSESEWGS